MAVEGMLRPLSANRSIGKAGTVKAAQELLESADSTRPKLVQIGGPAADPREMRRTAERLLVEAEELRCIIEILGGELAEADVDDATAKAEAKIKKVKQRESRKLAAAGEPDDPSTPLKPGDQGELVRQAQARLRTLGYDVNPDGQYGPETEGAVTSFQSDHQLRPDAIVGPNTRTAMRGTTPEMVQERRGAQPPGGGSAELTNGESDPDADADNDADAKGDTDADAAKPQSGQESAPDADSDGDTTTDTDADTEADTGGTKPWLTKGLGWGGEPDGDVKKVQNALIGMGTHVGDAGPDGKFGPETEKGVKRIQRRYGLKADGMVGPKTHDVLSSKGELKEAWSFTTTAGTTTQADSRALRAKTQRQKAREEAKSSSSSGGASNSEFEAQHPRGTGEQGGQFIKKGQSGAAVRAVQQEIGMGQPTGNFDQATVKAVKQYQRDNGLAVDGIVGAQTAASLLGSTARAPGALGQNQEVKLAQMIKAKGKTKGRGKLQEAELDSKARKELKDSDFAIPEKRAYPIHDEAHARNALARVAQHGSPEEKKRVRAAVKRKHKKLDVAEVALEIQTDLEEASLRSAGRTLRDILQIKRLNDGTFAPEGRGRVLRPSDDVRIGGIRGKVTPDGLRVRMQNGRSLPLASPSKQREDTDTPAMAAMRAESYQSSPALPDGTAVGKPQGHDAKAHGFESLHTQEVSGKHIAQGRKNFQTFTGKGDTPEAAIEDAKKIRDGGQASPAQSPESAVGDLKPGERFVDQDMTFEVRRKQGGNVVASPVVKTTGEPSHVETRFKVGTKVTVPGQASPKLGDQPRPGQRPGYEPPPSPMRVFHKDPVTGEYREEKKGQKSPAILTSTDRAEWRSLPGDEQAYYGSPEEYVRQRNAYHDMLDTEIDQRVADAADAQAMTPEQYMTKASDYFDGQMSPGIAVGQNWLGGDPDELKKGLDAIAQGRAARRGDPNWKDAKHGQRSPSIDVNDHNQALAMMNPPLDGPEMDGKIERLSTAVYWLRDTKPGALNERGATEEAWDAAMDVIRDLEDRPGGDAILADIEKDVDLDAIHPGGAPWGGPEDEGHALSEIEKLADALEKRQGDITNGLGGGQRSPGMPKGRGLPIDGQWSPSDSYRKRQEAIAKDPTGGYQQHIDELKAESATALTPEAKQKVADGAQDVLMDLTDDLAKVEAGGRAWLDPKAAREAIDELKELGADFDEEDFDRQVDFYERRGTAGPPEDYTGGSGGQRSPGVGPAGGWSYGGSPNYVHDYQEWIEPQDIEVGDWVVPAKGAGGPAGPDTSANPLEVVEKGADGKWLLRDPMDYNEYDVSAADRENYYAVDPDPAYKQYGEGQASPGVSEEDIWVQVDSDPETADLPEGEKIDLVYERLLDQLGGGQASPGTVARNPRKASIARRMRAKQRQASRVNAGKRGAELATFGLTDYAEAAISTAKGGTRVESGGHDHVVAGPPINGLRMADALKSNAYGLRDAWEAGDADEIHNLTGLTLVGHQQFKAPEGQWSPGAFAPNTGAVETGELEVGQTFKTTDGGTYVVHKAASGMWVIGKPVDDEGKVLKADPIPTGTKTGDKWHGQSRRVFHKNSAQPYLGPMSPEYVEDAAAEQGATAMAAGPPKNKLADAQAAGTPMAGESPSAASSAPVAAEADTGGESDLEKALKASVAAAAGGELPAQQKKAAEPDMPVPEGPTKGGPPPLDPIKVASPAWSPKGNLRAFDKMSDTKLAKIAEEMADHLDDKEGFEAVSAELKARDMEPINQEALDPTPPPWLDDHFDESLAGQQGWTQAPREGGKVGSLTGVSLSQLTKALGPPHHGAAVGDGDSKSDVGWSFTTPGGKHIEVWNYKNGPAYTGTGDVEDITSWSVGGTPALLKLVGIRPDGDEGDGDSGLLKPAPASASAFAAPKVSGPEWTDKTKKPPKNPALSDSPARSATGNVRNIPPMSDVKLAQTRDDMELYGPENDPDATEWLNMELEKRGFDPLPLGGADPMQSLKDAEDANPGQIDYSPVTDAAAAREPDGTANTLENLTDILSDYKVPVPNTPEGNHALAQIVNGSDSLDQSVEKAQAMFGQGVGQTAIPQAAMPTLSGTVHGLGEGWDVGDVLAALDQLAGKGIDLDPEIESPETLIAVINAAGLKPLGGVGAQTLGAV